MSSLEDLSIAWGFKQTPKAKHWLKILKSLNTKSVPPSIINDEFPSWAVNKGLRYKNGDKPAEYRIEVQRDFANYIIEKQRQLVEAINRTSNTNINNTDKSTIVDPLISAWGFKQNPKAKQYKEILKSLKDESVPPAMIFDDFPTWAVGYGLQYTNGNKPADYHIDVQRDFANYITLRWRKIMRTQNNQNASNTTPDNDQGKIIINNSVLSYKPETTNQNANSPSSSKTESKLKLSKVGKKTKNKLNYMNHKPQNISKAEFDQLRLHSLDSKSKYISSPKNGFMSRDFPYNEDFINPNYAAWYAHSKGGEAYRGDFNNDGVDDVVIMNKNGIITHVNGYQSKPSKRGKLLKYYDSPEYQNSNHTTLRGLVDVFNSKKFKEWATKYASEKKSEANKILKQSGYKQFKVAKKTLNQELMDASKILYTRFIAYLCNKYGNDPENGIEFSEYKKLIKRRLPASSFASTIVNTLLSFYGGIDLTTTDHAISNELSILKKSLKSNSEITQTVKAICEAVIAYLGSESVLNQFGDALYESIAEVSNTDNTTTDHSPPEWEESQKRTKGPLYAKLAVLFDTIVSGHLDDIGDYFKRTLKDYWEDRNQKNKNDKTKEKEKRKRDEELEYQEEIWKEIAEANGWDVPEDTTQNDAKNTSKNDAKNVSEATTEAKPKNDAKDDGKNTSKDTTEATTEAKPKNIAADNTPETTDVPSKLQIVKTIETQHGKKQKYINIDLTDGTTVERLDGKETKIRTKAKISEIIVPRHNRRNGYDFEVPVLLIEYGPKSDRKWFLDIDFDAMVKLQKLNEKSLKMFCTKFANIIDNRKISLKEKMRICRTLDLENPIYRQMCIEMGCGSVIED